MNYLNYDRNAPPTEQNAGTNLDQDLKISRLEKYAKSETEIKQWIFDTLKTPHDTQQQYHAKNYDLLDILKDGELLCSLGNLLGAPNCPTKRYKSLRMPFVQMENISFFLDTCKLIGVPHNEIFQTVDLYERQDPYQIVITLILFSRKANSYNSQHFPRPIGPKLVKPRPPVPRKPIQLSVSK